MTARTKTSAHLRAVFKIAGWLLLLCIPAFGLAACSGSTNASSNTSTTTPKPPKGESAVNAPLRVKYGSGSIGAPDPTTTYPSEQGQTIEPGVNPGQNIIIKAGRVFPQTLEASVDAPIVWYNLSGSPQRIIFDNGKYFPADSGTIPPGATFIWTPPDSALFSYTLEPSGYLGKVDLNGTQGGP